MKTPQTYPETTFQKRPGQPLALIKSITISAIALASGGIAHAQYNPIALTPGSYNADMVVEQITTATLDAGTGNTGYTWYERGNSGASFAINTGVPPAGSTFVSESASDHSYQMAPDYRANDAILIDSTVTSDTITLNSPAAFSALSFLESSGGGGVTINYTVHHADSTTETGNFTTTDWFGGGSQALTVNGRVDVSNVYQYWNWSTYSGVPKIFGADISLTDTSSPVTSIDLSYSSGGGHACILALSGSTGSGFTPIAITGYNEDMIAENISTLNNLNQHYTTQSLDGGNSGNSWYELGYDKHATSTGVPHPGTTIVDLSHPDHSFTFAPSYEANNAGYIDSGNNATFVLASPDFFSGLSFLGSAGNGPVVANYSVNHADGTSEYGQISVPDWFAGGLVSYDANGRVDVTGGFINNENSSFPRMFSMDIPVNNTGSQVISVQLSYVSGGRAGIMAMSGVSAATAPTAPFNLSITPPAQSQFLGGNAFISAAAKGTLPLSFQWNSNNVPIAGATSSTLALTGLTAGNAATYTCTITNIGGSAVTGGSVLTILSVPPNSSGVVVEDKPLVYYRMNEGPVVPSTAGNSGSLGAAGNGFYFPGSIAQVPGAIVGDPDTARLYTGIDTNSEDGCTPTVVPYNPAFNPSGSFSVEAWLLPNAQGNLGNAQAPFNNQFNDSNGNRIGWDFFQRAADQETPDANGPGISFRMFNGTAGTEAQTTVFNITGGDYVVGQWFHLVAVYDASVPSATLYLNGQQVAQSTTPNGTYVANTNANLGIGGYPDGAQNPFLGAMDEVALYSNALSAAQVLAHYQNGTNAQRSTSYSALITSDHAVEYLRLDEPAVNVATNIGTLGPIANGTYSDTQNGVAGPQPPTYTGFELNNTAVSFNTSNSYVELENPPALNFSHPITLEAWILPAATQAFESYILAHGYNDDNSGEVFLRIENGSYEVGSLHGKAVFAIPGGDLGGGQWIHLVGTWDGANWNLYRNSALVATAADTSGPTVVNNANWAIGARGRWKRETGLVDPGQDTRIFNGSIDEAAIYGYALSSSRVQAHYQAGLNLAHALSVSSTGGVVTVTWPAGTLQQSANPAGPYTDVLGNPGSPYNPPAGTKMFYRIRF
jgi:hypothetical protein